MENTNGSYRAFNGEIKVLQKQSDWLYGVEIWLLNDKVNRNNWQFTDMAGHKDLFRGTPILIAYINGGRGIGDGHNYRSEIDQQTGEERPSFTDATAERIVGSLSDDPADFRLVKRDGTTWIVGKGNLWKWYAKELVDKIERDALQGRSMSVSIEALVTESHMDGDVEVETKYEILGTTILGDHVLPAVADARITALQEIGQRFNELKIRAASYTEKGGKKEPPENSNKGVKRHNMTYFSKQQCSELEKRFEGYTVLAAAQTESGAINVCLTQRDKQFTYTMSAIGETIVPEKIISVNAQTCFPFENETVDIDTCEVTGALAAEIEEKTCALEKANADLAALTQKVTEMQTAENARRLSAAAARADAVLAAFNANRAEKVDVKVLDAIKADITAGKYTSCIDENGAWDGENRVAEKVKALCADAVMALDAETARKNQTVHVWDKFGTRPETHTDNGDVGSLLERTGIR